MNSDKTDIRSLSLAQLREHFVQNGMKAFRGNQVFAWLWKKGATDFDNMTDLPFSVRAYLHERFSIRTLRIVQRQTARDGTVKYALELYDKAVIETVLIPTDRRITACVSCQVGCAMGCKFCATATLKKQRNLTAGEIFDQVMLIDRESRHISGRGLTNIVLMGMGEPLANYHEVMKAIEILTSPEGRNLSPKRITLSTVGLPKMIRRMADEGVRCNLAVSLHSARDIVRSRMMPVNEKSNTGELLSALQYWYRLTGNRITFEYIVWKGVNDKPEDMEALIQYARKVPAKVNLIPYNPVDEYDWQAADESVMDEYQRRLKAAGIVTLRRESRGKDIDAACGQLANKSV